VVTLEFNLTDGNGDPVPDATIEIWVDGWGGGGNAQGFWLLSDDQGHAEVEVGENRNYYMRILSSIGDYPEQKAATPAC
jgi:protocatechuate 3,4-dioxygenase beta subunit